MEITTQDISKPGEGGFDTIDFSDLETGGVEVDFTYSNSFKIRNNGEGQKETMYSIEKVIGTKYTDTLTGDQGRHIDAGGGDDTLKIDFLKIDFSDIKGTNTKLDGGAGSDTLHSTKAGNFNLSDFGSIIDNIETLDFSKNGSDTIALSNDDFSSLTGEGNQLEIKVDSTDTITVNGATVTENQSFRYDPPDDDSGSHTITVYIV